MIDLFWDQHHRTSGALISDSIRCGNAPICLDTLRESRCQRSYLSPVVRLFPRNPYFRRRRLLRFYLFCIGCRSRFHLQSVPLSQFLGLDFRKALVFSLLESEVHPAMAFRFRSPLCVPSCCVTLYFCKKVSGEGGRLRQRK